MSCWTKTNDGLRMCSMFSSVPVSRLSTQSTRWPSASRRSQRCEPRNPAPPVTTEVGTPDSLPPAPAPAPEQGAHGARALGQLRRGEEAGREPDDDEGDRGLDHQQ